jgi:hypothetical protein
MKLLRTLQLGQGLNRRQLLKALGLSAAAVPLMPRLDSWAADGPPLRLMLCFSSSGTVPELWWPTGTETNWNFPANGSLLPLTKHKGDMIILKNLKRGASGGGGHEQSMGGLWTGNSCQSSVAQAASVDQIIAKNLPKLTDFQSYPFGALSFYANDGDITSKIKNNNPYMIHTGPGQKVASECDPYKNFDKLFGNIATTAPGKPVDTGAADQLRAEKKSIIDALKDELADVGGRVAREDKVKIDSHLEAVRDIERRLQPGTGPQITGAIPTRPAGNIDLTKSANYPMIIDLQNKLIVATLASDRTRITSLQYSRGFSQVKHTWVGANSDHHTLSHMTNQAPVLAKIQGWYAERFASLIDQLKAVPEAGKTLFDSTLLVYSNELSLGWTHGCSPAATWWATGAAGRFGGKIKGTGRFLDGIGDYNQMLVTMCHAMGVTSVQRVGDFATVDGPLPGVLA